jgi:ABC-type branched-subunit amino acid transport system substrate-binding protein
MSADATESGGQPGGKRTILGGSLLSLLLLILPACASSPQVLKIGFAGPFEGRHRQVGYDALYGARLAIREVNSSGAAGDKMLALEAVDDFGEPEMAGQVAAAMAADAAVVAVVGHWLAETTAAARPIYDEAGVALVPAGERPFQSRDPAGLPATFLEAYAALTPFDEVAGPYSAPAYDAVRLLAAAIFQAGRNQAIIDREDVTDALDGLVYRGLTGLLTIQP